MTKSFFIPLISNKPLTVDETYEGGLGRVLIVKSGSAKYALKTMKWELAISREDFAREVGLLVAAVQHPNIVEILGVEWIDGDPYFVMPYCPGSLAHEMRCGFRLEKERLETIVSSIAAALSHLHNRVGIVHLDLKPSNILVAQDGQLVLSDFGISRVLPKPEPNGIRKELFVSGGTGTLAYMSPEQLIGGMLGPATDIFALGVILFELLTGSHPFLSSTFKSTAENILTKRPSFDLKARAQFPSGLRELVLECLSKGAADRPTAEEILIFIKGNRGARELSLQASDPIREVNKANALGVIGRKEEARAILQACLDKYPTELTVHINLAKILFDLGEIDEARLAAEKAFEIAKWAPSSDGSIGTLLTNLSLYYLPVDPKRAIELAKAAVMLDPEDWQALGNLAEGARLLGCDGKDKEILGEAFEAVNRALVINPDDRRLNTTLGGVLLAQGEIMKAWNLVRNLVNTHGGDHVSLRMLLIEIYIRSGHLEEAKKWLAPMRGHEPLEKLVAQADRNIAIRRQS